MPWTDDSDPTSPAAAQGARQPGRPPDGGQPEGKGLDDAASEASSPNAGRPAGAKIPGGPWGAAPRKSLDRPGKSPPASPPAAGPDLDKLLRSLNARASGVQTRLARPGLRRRMAMGALVGFAAGWAVSGVYVVRPDERAVVTRLGAVERVTGPGLHAHLPWPLEQSQSLSVTRIDTLALGGAAEDGSQALTPTADAQLAAVAYAVRWRIADPVAYLHHIDDPQGALRLAAQAAMRQAVGATPLNVLMNADPASLQRTVAAAIQRRLDRLGAGVAVAGVSIQAISLPPDVQAAAGDVASAREDAQGAIAEAQAYRARTIAQARATAAKALIDAESYRDQTIIEAKGAAARFEDLDAAYRKAPGVTKDRLYFETLQGVLSRAHTVVLDPTKGATVTLPPDLIRGAPRAAAPASSPAPTPGGSAASPGATP